MVFRFAASILVLMALLAALVVLPGAEADFAAACTPNDATGETNNDHTSVGAAATDTVTGFAKIEIVAVCVQEDATNVGITVVYGAAPSTGAGQNFDYKVQFNNASAAFTCTYVIRAAATPTGCTVTPAGTATLQYKFSRTAIGPSGSALRNIVTWANGTFIDPATSAVTSGTDRAPQTGVLFPSSAPYQVGSRAPVTLDSDGDGAPDRAELENGTDPSSMDTDHDGLLDGASQSVAPGSSAEANFTAAGILFLQESGMFAGEAEFGTNATNPDTDLDGLLDGADIRVPVGDPVGAYFQSFGVTPAETGPSDELYIGEFSYGSDPLLRDTDGDGLDDRDEILGTRNQLYRNESFFPAFPGSTSPEIADSDSDNLPDGAEIAGVYEAPNGTRYTFDPTDPNNADTDGDGIQDGNEVLQGLNPTSRDTDGDGATDDEELGKGTDPRDPNDKPVVGVQSSGTDVAYLVLSSVALAVVILLCIVGILVRWG